MEIDILSEKKEFVYSEIHKLWCRVKLTAPETYICSPGKDLVIVLDASRSMLDIWSTIQATMEYIIKSLSINDRLCIIIFNEKVYKLYPLCNITGEYKFKLLSTLQGIKPKGNSNTGDAIMTAIDVINNDPKCRYGEQIIILFTASIPNAGPQDAEFYKKFNVKKIPKSLTIHTFGYGSNHDSKMLRTISLKSNNGLYHFIENKESIPSVIGQWFSSMLTVYAKNVHVRIIGQDGCRIIGMYTVFPIQEKCKAKEYNISLPDISMGESQTILFKLSIKKMQKEINEHSLISISVEYNSMEKLGMSEKKDRMLSVFRPEKNTESTIPLALDEEINRHLGGNVLDLVENENIKTNAVEKIEEVIAFIKNSPSGNTEFCINIINDLCKCKNELNKPNGLHNLNALAIMYLMQKSSGFNSKNNYLSAYQKNEASIARRQIKEFHAGYSQLQCIY